jgi:hypothetical protein
MSNDTKLHASDTSKPQNQEAFKQRHASVKTAVRASYDNLMRGRGVREDAGASTKDMYGGCQLLSTLWVFIGCVMLCVHIYGKGMTGLNTPNDGRLATVFPLLMILGSDTLHKVFAAHTASLPPIFGFLPCFGMLGCSFAILVSAWGNTTLLPKPEYPAKVINLKSGKTRGNSSFVLSHVLRNLETEHPSRE